MLSVFFRASRKRDLLLEQFFATLRAESSPRPLVHAFTPLLAEMTKYPRDEYYQSAMESGFNLLHGRLSRNDFVMVALHVMGQTNQPEYNTGVGRDMAFAHVQSSFKDSLYAAAESQAGNRIVGLIFAARSVVLSSLDAGNIAEARHIVSDLQSAIDAIGQGDVRGEDVLQTQRAAQASVLRQTVTELMPRVAI